jgi:hypothetical protein
MYLAHVPPQSKINCVHNRIGHDFGKAESTVSVATSLVTDWLSRP